MEPTDKRTKALPYHTGKVPIGSLYMPPAQNNLLSRDAYDLQTALLSPPVRGPWRVVRALSRFIRGAHHD